MINVRPATPDDLPWLMDQLRQFDAFAPGRSLFPDMAHAELRAQQMMAPPYVFLIAQDYRSLGFVAGVITPHFFTPEFTVLTELLWWVAPEHRMSRAGHVLLTAFKAYGVRQKVGRIQFSLLANSPVPPEALESRGFQLVESSYAMDL